MVDPRMSNLGRTAKYWLNLRPGTDNAMALGWCHIILKHDLVDWQFVKRWSNASFIVVPDMEPTGYTEAVQNTKSPYEYRTRLLTEADIDPSMVDWEVEGEGNPKRYLVYDQLNIVGRTGRPTLKTLIGRVRRGRSKPLASLRTSRVCATTSRRLLAGSQICRSLIRLSIRRLPANSK